MKVVVDNWTHTATGASVSQKLGIDNPSSIEQVSAPTRHVQVSGTFTGTVQIQGSVDGQNFYDIGSALTAPALKVIEDGVPYIRTNCTAYTSGTISVGVSKFVD